MAWTVECMHNLPRRNCVPYDTYVCLLCETYPFSGNCFIKIMPTQKASVCCGQTKVAIEKVIGVIRITGWCTFGMSGEFPGNH
jgi:hypothetical protein